MQEKIDEAGDQPRFVGGSPIAEKTDEVADQPCFDDRPPVEEQRKIDEVANQLRLVELSQRASQEEIDEAGDQARSVGRSPIVEKIDEVADQPRFDDRPPIEDQRKIDEAVDPLRFVDHSSVADQGRVDEVANRLRPVDDRFAGSDQKPMPEIEQPQVDMTFRRESVEAGSIVDDNAREVDDRLIPPIDQAKTVGWSNYQFSTVNRLRLSIGALMILVVVAGGLAVFYPRQREAAVPGNRYAENLSRRANKTAVPAVPVDNVKNSDNVNTKKVVEEPPQPVLATPPPSSHALENRDQNRDTPKKQNVVEAGNSGKTTDPASQEIYRVSRASFLRKTPAANAEIIDTLKPGIRIVVTNRSGEYVRVRSLSDEKVSGFVHKEDAFFERIRQ